MVTATSTIVFVDAVGSTSLRARLGEEDADRRFRQWLRDLSDVVRGHGGQVVKTAGDGLMAAFSSASEAVRAAAAMQRAATGAAALTQLRVGVASGDVSWEDDDCFGLPVVTAARLEATAEPGQVLVTGLVRALAGDRPGATFVLLGLVELKGLPDTVEVYTLDLAAGTRDVPRPFDVPCPPAIAATPVSPFVGRDAERRQLEEVWAAVTLGQRRTVLIGGEPGAGKTRLAFEFAWRSAGDGATVLLGVCDTELAIPYQPWAGALDQLIRAMSPEVRASLSGPLADVLPLVPQLERALPGLERGPQAEPEAERYRLFNGVNALLTEAARSAPLLVVIDDLHWAGATTLSMLRHLAQSAGTSPLAIVGTFRDTGDEITDPLAGCLADLRRSATTSRLRLSGLDGGAVEQFVEGAVGHPLDAGLRSLASTLATHSGGNAFYVGELWRHAVGTGLVERVDDRWFVRRPADVGVPDSVREVVAQRVGRLSAPARTVLEIAAIAGQRVEGRTLEAAAGLPPTALGAGVDELVEDNLLIEVPSTLPEYQFVHAIVRDTVARTIPRSARDGLHRRMAEALELVHRADLRPVLAQLARHFSASTAVGDDGKALRYLRLAAAQALRSVAYDEAIEHLTVALELSEPASAERVDVLLELAAARVRNGLSQDGSATYVEAFRAADEQGFVARATQAAEGFSAMQQELGRDGADVVEMVSRALELYGEEETAVSVRLQAALARGLAMSGHTARAAAVGETALAAARRIGDPGALITALQSALVFTLEPHRNLRDATEVITLATELGDTWAEVYAHGCILRALLVLGRVEEARSVLQTQQRAAVRGRYALYRYQAITFDAMIALIDGRFDDAERLAMEAHDFGSSARSDFDDGVYGVQMYAIRRAQGRLGEVAPALRLAARMPDQPMWRPGLAAALAEIGMHDEARRELDRLAVDGFAAVARDSMWPGSLALLADVCAAVGAVDHAPVLYDELGAFLGQTLMAGYTVCLGPAERLMGNLAALMGRPDDARTHFAAALDLAGRSGSPLWRAEVERDLAAAETDALDHATIVEATSTGPAPLPTRTPGLSAVAPSPPAQLSAREVEVLQLVAAGLSNRAIGARLSISTNAATDHVRSILEKTGSANRTEATAYAARHGLLDD